jgi:DNA polymerase, archaea type
MKITIGSTIIGKSGKGLIVDRVEGDILWCGDLKILASAVINVIPPTTSFKQGDRVKIVSTGEIGRLGVGFHNRKLAIVDLDDGTRSGWTSWDDLVRVYLDEECSHIGGMFEKVYVAGWDKIKEGDICYGAKGEPLEYIDRDCDKINVKNGEFKFTTDISNIKLMRHEHYKAFRWITPPGERIASAAAKGYDFHPRQLIAIGEWSDPITDIYEGQVVNKRFNTGFGYHQSIPDTLRVMWVDSSKLDLNYTPQPTPPVDELPQQLRDYASIPKLYIDIETTGLDPLNDRVTMFGVRNQLGENFIFTDPDESQLLREAIECICATQPELIFMHNGYGFDIPFIMTRCALHVIEQPFDACYKQVNRKIKDNAHGALHHAFERDPDSPEYGGKMTPYEAFEGKCTVIDTMVAIGLWDTTKTLPNLKLKSSVIKLKLRTDTRLELTNDEIQECWVNNDLDRLREYLVFDLEDTELLANKIMPTIWYQQAYIPNVTIMELVHKNTGFKAQKMYEYLCPSSPHPPDPKADYGGGLTGAITGIHRDVGKIDVASLYPSLMVRYGLGSRKDPQGRYISVLKKMLTDRLEYKRRGKEGDRQAAGMAEAIKLLMNSAYGALGTQGYSFNDMENAALVTSYGQVVLRLMSKTIEDDGGVIVSADTDGLYFSHSDPDTIFDLVSNILPSGVNIELEKRDLVMFSRSKKNYCLYNDRGELLEMKGNSFISNNCPIESQFVKEYPRILITEGQLKADKYYREIFDNLIGGNIDINLVSTTQKILKGWGGKMERLGISEPSTVTYYYARHDFHQLRRNYTNSRTYHELETLSTNYPDIPYFGEYYAYKIECLRALILNTPKPSEWWKDKPRKTVKNKKNTKGRS